MGCNSLLGPYIQENAVKEVMPSNCPECQSKGPFILNSEHVSSLPHQTRRVMCNVQIPGRMCGCGIVVHQTLPRFENLTCHLGEPVPGSHDL